MDLKLDHWGRSRAKLTKNSFVGRSFFWNRYSIPVSPLFLVHIRGVYKWSAHSCMPWVHHVACTAQPQGHTGMGQVFTFTRYNLTVWHN